VLRHCANRFTACAALLALYAQPANAQEERVRLDYEAETELGCPSSDEFRREVATRLGRDPFATTARHTIVVRITRGDKQPVGHVSWRDEHGTPGGERHFQAVDTDCQKLAANMAFSVTVQIQLAMPTETEPVRSEPAKPTDGSETAPFEQNNGNATGSQERLQFLAGAGASTILGWSPDATFGGRVFFGVRSQTLSLEAGLEKSLASRFERPDGSGFESSVLAGVLVPCIRYKRLAGCGVLHLGQLRTQGFGVDEPRSQTGFLAHAGLRLALSQPLGSVEAAFHAETTRSLSPWRVELNQDEAWRQPGFSALFGIDLAVPF
jgi:hypothetical protein